MQHSINLLLVAVVIAPACTRATHSGDAPDKGLFDEDSGAKELPFVRTTLPGKTSSDCEPSTRPSVCDWAQSMDAIVVGNIEDRKILDTPYWVRNDANPHLQDQCPTGHTFLGVTFEISVSSILYGDAPEHVTVKVGGRALHERWPEQARVDAAGRFFWFGGRGDGPMEVGTTVGLALMQNSADGSWSLMGERPFTFTSTGSLLFNDPVCGPRPPAPEPADYWALDSELANCQRQTNTRHVSKADNFTTSDPDWIYAATCNLFLNSNNNLPPDTDAGTPDAGASD